MQCHEWGEHGSISPVNIVKWPKLEPTITIIILSRLVYKIVARVYIIITV